MNRALPFAALAAISLASCVQKHVRPGSPPTGARYTIGYPYFAMGEWHYPRALDSYDRTGLAAIIPPDHDAATSDGEAFHARGLMAQSPVLPLPSLVNVTNLVTGRTLTLRVNDRGPATPGRIIAVSRQAAALLAFPANGVVEIRVRLLGSRSAALQAALGAGPHLTTAPLTGVRASALPPPPGAAGTAGVVTQAQAPAETASAPPIPSLSGIVRAGTPDPGPLYVEMGGFGSQRDAQSLMNRLDDMPGTTALQFRDGRTLYAVRLGPYHSVATADAALRQVLQRGVPDPEITVH